MKKLIKYMLICVIVVVAIPPKQSSLNNLIKQYGYTDAVCTYYSYEDKNIIEANKIVNGNCVQYSCSFSNANNVETQLKNSHGESVKFNANFGEFVDLKNKLLCKVCYFEEIDNITTYYGFNKKLNNSIIIDNKAVNIQIAFNGEQIVVGTPVILGSF